MDRSSRKKINKEIIVLNDTLNQMDLIDNFRELHPKAAEYTFFSSAHGTFSKIDHVLGQETTLNKLKKTEIISFVFFDYIVWNYKSIIRKKTEKHTHMEAK